MKCGASNNICRDNDSVANNDNSRNNCAANYTDANHCCW